VLSYRSELAASPERVWAWIVSAAGIARELRPIMKMTMPRGLVNLDDVTVEPGKPLFRSWLLLFGLLPFDFSDLTLLRLDPGRGFLEESPMRSMKRWRHERWLEPAGAGTVLTDRLTFEPRFAAPLVTAFVRALFANRHRVLRRDLG
jgi:ligand-binding SRPBCC domain-containing protein